MLSVVDHRDVMQSLPPEIKVGACWKKGGELAI